MTKKETEALRSIADCIRELASLENARFCMDDKTDAETKRRISPYMSWFELCADNLDEILNLQDASRSVKDDRLSYIIRSNH